MTVLLLLVAGLSLRSGEQPADGPAVARQVAMPSKIVTTPQSEQIVAAPAPIPIADLARVGRLIIAVPGRDPVAVGYHEASLSRAQTMTPIGMPLRNDDASDFTTPPGDPHGTAYYVMAGRGRPLPPASAVDVVLPEGRAVLAPVDGTVTEVRAYRLYGKYADVRVAIKPDDDPDLRVVMIHMRDVAVHTGDRIRTGVTEIAGQARQFPFGSQIENYLDQRRPHVHIEVQRPR